MLQFSRSKIITVLLICFLGFVYAAPNMIGANTRGWMNEHLPSWIPSQTINLGLDLRGGVHRVMEADIDSVIVERADDIGALIRSDLRDEKIVTNNPIASTEGVRITLRQADEVAAARKIMFKAAPDLVISEDGNTLIGKFDDAFIKDLTDKTIAQSIEIVRRRIDETGTREPIIQRQGERRILIQIPGLEDTSELDAILGKTAKLSFHLVNVGARHAPGSKLLPMAEDPGEEISVQRRAMLTGDMLTNAQAGFQEGQPIVTFRLNGLGARKFCKVTTENTRKPFAIVLDDVVLSAPNINEPICGGSAQISGRFSVEEVSQLALLLRAGALPTELYVVEERSVGPSLGADSVEAGKKASIVGMLLVLAFMVLSYGTFGIFADIALMVNMALIFALLSGLQATLTLPGIAGIVLTIGMAVDANVLIFERIKEELRSGKTVMTAIDAGYNRAMTTIIDSNVTTLIAAILLYSFGTGPVKGFAVTLGIGIATSFFSAIMVTRLLVVLWLKRGNNAKGKELPI
ncbi:MAG: protein translocase subunit SecD [Alphaproteobacteria bacterium]